MLSFLNINPQLAYILGVILCSGVFWFAGRLIMQGSRFRLARYVLLGSAFVSLLIPLLKIGVFEPVVVEETVLAGSNFASFGEVGEVVEVPFWTFDRVAMLGYCFVAFLLILRLVVGVVRLKLIEKRSFVVSQGSIKVVTNSSIRSPFSFGRTIFVGNTNCETSRAMILRHEEEHIRLHHSLDKTLMEFLSSIFWINPFFFLIKRSLTEVHEFEADNAVVEAGFNIADYKQLIFSQIGSDNPEVASGLVFSLTKKRIIMLSRTKNGSWVRLLTLIPAVALSLVLVSFTERSSQVELPDPKVESVSSSPSMVLEGINVGKVELDKKGDTPLFFLDGKEIKSEQLSTIAPETIGTIEVFKSDKAIALYGERAKNGVVVITIHPKNELKGSISGIDGKKFPKNELKGSISGISGIDGKKTLKISGGEITIRSDGYEMSVGGGKEKFDKSLEVFNTSDPLYVVDGIEVSSAVLQTIDVETIASMEVLKDDKMVSKYGDKAKNGVIIITTKPVKTK